MTGHLMSQLWWVLQWLHCRIRNLEAIKETENLIYVHTFKHLKMVSGLGSRYCIPYLLRTGSVEATLWGTLLVSMLTLEKHRSASCIFCLGPCLLHTFSVHDALCNRVSSTSCNWSFCFFGWLQSTKRKILQKLWICRCSQQIVWIQFHATQCSHNNLIHGYCLIITRHYMEHYIINYTRVFLWGLVGWS